MELLDLYWHTYNDHLKEMMHNLLLSHESSDVTLVCEDKTKFKAHKFVLNACSPVFQSIINELAYKDPVIYLRGVPAQEMKSILQFMYFGQATLFQDRFNDFLNVAKSLEIKEISKDLNCDVDDSSQDQSYVINIKPNIENLHQEDTIVNPSIDDELLEHIDTKGKNHVNEAGKYPCNKCDKQFSHVPSLYKHKKSAHEGIKFPCRDYECNYEATTKQHLGIHIQSIHEGIRYPCNMCVFKATTKGTLFIHKKIKH